MGIELKGIHEFNNATHAIEAAEGVFVGGGNTFVLLRQLYEQDLMPVLRRRIDQGMPYLGTSAGTNVAGISIGSSNDMPIVFPPSFDGLAVVPFNINPHFPRSKPDPKHRGETREQRIAEFHFFNEQDVICLHEDGMLRVCHGTTTLIGDSPAYRFRRGQKPETLEPGGVLQDSNSED
jgi:dipeptidase E